MYRSFHLHLLSKISGSAPECQPHDLSHTCWLLTTPFTGRIVLLTLFRQELYFPDVEVGNHSATCDVIIFDVTRLF